MVLERLVSLAIVVSLIVIECYSLWTCGEVQLITLIYFRSVFIPRWNFHLPYHFNQGIQLYRLLCRCVSQLPTATSQVVWDTRKRRSTLHLRTLLLHLL